MYFILASLSLQTCEWFVAFRIQSELLTKDFNIYGHLKFSNFKFLRLKLLRLNNGEIIYAINKDNQFNYMRWEIFNLLF